jgi:ADP-dependent NAD(P)H-hydrate dehydratase / NAD(P)H-hydrate epimerase
LNLYKAKEVRDLETKAIKALNGKSIILMERAASATFKLIKENFNLKKFKFLVCYGSGNNGGDGLSLARILIENKAKVSICSILGSPKTDDSKKEHFLLKKLKPKFIYKKDLKSFIDSSVIVVDAIFGIGFKGNLNKSLKDIFKTFEKAYSVVSVDVPSGVNADTGEASIGSVTSDMTLTFIAPKLGLYSSPGAIFAGNIFLDNLGVKNNLKSDYFLSTESIAKKISKKLYRKKDTHKKTFGSLAILSPNEGMEGAVGLASKASLKTGTGLVSVLTYKESIKDFRNRTGGIIPREVMVKNIDDVNVNDFDAILIGPGFGTKRKDFLKSVIKDFKKKLILDADAINIISKDIKLQKLINRKQVILTPHPGEFYRLSKIKDIQEKRIFSLEKFMKNKRYALVLKGYRTLIKGDKKLYINQTGGPALAKAGSGDVLSGIIASLFVQGLNPLDASILGTYIHGMAADKLTKNLKLLDLNVNPSDVIKKLKEVFVCLSK